MKSKACTDESIPFKATVTLTRSVSICGGELQKRTDDEIIDAGTPCSPKKQIDGTLETRCRPTTVTMEDPCAGPVDGERLSNSTNSM